MPGVSKSPMPAPQQYPANAWLRLAEAAAYVRISPSGLRSAVHRGQIRFDGRGYKSTLMFRVATLDAYLASRAQCYTGQRYATAGDMDENDGKTERSPDALPRRDQAPRRQIPASLESPVPEDGSTDRTGADRGGAVSHRSRPHAGRPANDNAGHTRSAGASRDILNLLAQWQAEDAQTVDP